MASAVSEREQDGKEQLGEVSTRMDGDADRGG